MEHGAAGPVAVVGGGPVGLFTARELAVSGIDVTVFEEHPEIGWPVQCAGLLSPTIFSMAAIPELERSVLNECRGANIFSPGGKMITIRANEVKARVVDRAIFDRGVAGAAIKAGARLELSTRVEGCERNASGSMNVHVRSNDTNRTVKAGAVVGAYGPQSGALEPCRVGTPGYMFSGFQAEVDGIDTEMDMVQLYMDQSIAPGFFSWVIPVDRGLARVGLGALGPPTPARVLLERFLASRVFLEHNGISDTRKLKLLELNAGGIPIGMPKRIVADGVVLVGDAAGVCKPVSGGGIFTGFTSARCAARTLEEALARKDTSQKFLKQYPRRLDAAVGKELKRSLMMRNVYMGFTNDRIEELFEVIHGNGIPELIGKSGDIDHPYSLALKLVRKAPRLGRFLGPVLGSFLR